MSQYADMMQILEKWENEDLNAAETAYYIDVQARISKKILHRKVLQYFSVIEIIVFTLLLITSIFLFYM